MQIVLATVDKEAIPFYYVNAMHHGKMLFTVLNPGFPRIFKIYFPYFLNTFSILNLKSSKPCLLFIFRNS